MTKIKQAAWLYQADIFCLFWIKYHIFYFEVDSIHLQSGTKPNFGSQNVATNFGNHLWMVTKIGSQCLFSVSPPG